MSLDTPIERDNRRRDIIAAVGQVAFDFDAPLWSGEDLWVGRRTGGDDDFGRVTAGYAVAVAADNRSAIVTFAAPPRPDAGTAVTIRLEGRRTHKRELDVFRDGALAKTLLERELDKQTTVLQELQRDVDEVGPAVFQAAARAKSAADRAEAGASAAATFDPAGYFPKTDFRSDGTANAPVKYGPDGGLTSVYLTSKYFNVINPSVAVIEARSTGTAADGSSEARVIVRARNGTVGYAEFGQRYAGEAYIWTHDHNWAFTVDGTLTLPGGGYIPSNGDIYTVAQGYNTWMTTLINRTSRIKLGSAAFFSRPGNTNAADLFLGGGAVIAGIGGGYDGRVHSVSYRTIMQTDIWGNWYAIGSD